MRKSGPFEWEALSPQSGFLSGLSKLQERNTHRGSRSLAGRCSMVCRARRESRKAVEGSPCQALAMLGQ